MSTSIRLLQATVTVWNGFTRVTSASVTTTRGRQKSSHTSSASSATGTSAHRRWGSPSAIA
ncbi:hypothetical protein ASG00_11500 [Microbacterium sp. Leaf351]|nr:hypothetical protein ASG00_11500 [Microbacterium sp. Leaf351]